MQNNISKEYIKARLIYNFSSFSGNIHNLKLAPRLNYKQLLLSDKNKFEKLVITLMYRSKNTLRKIPFLYNLIIKVKSKMLLQAKGMLFLDDLIMYPYDDFINLIFNRLVDRDPEVDAVKLFRVHMLNGASNRAIAFMIVMSDEFNNRKPIYNFKAFQRSHRVYSLKQKFFHLPLVGRFFKLILIPIKINYMLSRIDYFEDKFNEGSE